MIYLDNAATTFPKPEAVYDAMMDCMKNYCANPGRAGHKLAMKAAREIYDTRENIAKLFNIDNPMNIVFTNNATESLNLAIKGVVNAGDHIITTSMEHNSVIRPIKALEKLGIENTIVQCDKDGFLNIKDLEEAIRPNTKLIVTTHASNVCGTLVDIKSVSDIAKSHNILYLVDASQTAGVYNIDLKEISADMLAAPGHKGLLGPQGTGILYIREGLNLNILNYILSAVMNWGVILLIIIFQPEIRRALEQLGTNKFTKLFGMDKDIATKTKEDIYKIAIAATELSKSKTGGLIVIERDIKIKDVA